MTDHATRSAIQHVVRDYVEGMCQADMKKLQAAMMANAHCVQSALLAPHSMTVSSD